MPSNYDDQGQYLDDDLKYGRLIGNVLNPPAEGMEGGPMVASAAPPPMPVAAPPARPAAPPPPPPAAPAPIPGAVSPKGGTWADTVRRAQKGAMDSLGQSQQASDAIRSQPSVTDSSQPIEASIQKDSAATPYLDPQTGKVLDSAQQYKPGIGSRILRGVRGAVGGLLEGGPLGAVINSLPKDNPNAKVGTDYSAPNRAYQTVEAQRQSRLTAEQQQLANLLATNKEDTERLGKIGSEARATATGYSDVAKGATQQQNAESGTKGQSGVMAGLAKQGLIGTFDDDGKLTDVKPDESSPVFKRNQIKDDLYKSQTDLATANADLKRAQNNPNSPAYRLALAKQQTAAANASAAAVRANAYALNASAGNLGVDTQGNQIEGGATTADGKPIGSRFASPYIKQEGKTSQFNDVLGATDQLEATARALVKSGARLNDPVVAAAIAEPKGTFGKWVQGQVANGNMTAAQRDYVTNMRAYRENLQALRQSAGGGVSDAQVNRLMEMAPGANTPDLDFLLRQTGQIRNTAGRLSEGLPQMKGGHTVRTNANATAPSSDMPPDSVVKGMKEGQYVHGPSGSYRKVNGKLVKQ